MKLLLALFFSFTLFADEVEMQPQEIAMVETAFATGTDCAFHVEEWISEE